MNLLFLNGMRAAFGWLAAKFSMRKPQKHQVHQLAQYHPFMFGKLE